MVDMKQPGAQLDVLRRFEELNLHDSELMSVSVEQAEAERSARVHMRLLHVTDAADGQYDLRPATLSFIDCTEISMSIDFWNKSMMGHAIDHGSCRVDLERIAHLARDDPPRARSERLNELLVFTIVLSPISGEITMLARDFELSIQ